jgi:hypothetical protein
MKLIRSHRQELLEGGFSENITLLQRRPVEDLAKTLSLAYSLREERITNTMNEEHEQSDSTIGGNFKFGKEEDKFDPSTGIFRRSNTSNSTSSVPSTNGTRWGRSFFKTSSNTQVNIIPKTPPLDPSPSPPPKFSPGSWGVSLSAASRKLNKLRLSPSPTPDPDTSTSPLQNPVNLEERPNPISSINLSTTALGQRVTAVVRDSLERRNEIISKVGGWVANTHDPETRSSSSEWVEVDKPSETESKANEEIKRLEGEINKREKVEITPEEYIARIKRRQVEREQAEKSVFNKDVKGIDDPLGVGGVS